MRSVRMGCALLSFAYYCDVAKLPAPKVPWPVLYRDDFREAKRDLLGWGVHY